mgnify:CR=1 FL=1
MRSQQRKKKNQKRTAGGEGLNFAITLITLTVVFVFVGYLLGQYAVKFLKAQHDAQVRTVQTTPVISQNVTSTLPASQPQTEPEPPSQPRQPEDPQQVPVQPSSGQTLYRVQVGAFSQKENADRLAAQLRDLGYEVIVSSGPPYRVQTGAFSNRQNAVRLSEELQSKGFEAAVVN